MQIPQLDDVLAYQNQSVIKRYCDEHPGVSVSDAQQIFHDLLGWLWLGEHRRKRQLASHMIRPLAMLDNMWHTFILHTRNYADFCQHYFNRFLHHEVESLDHDDNIDSAELTGYFEECYEYLGERWLVRNFVGVIDSDITLS